MLGPGRVSICKSGFRHIAEFGDCGTITLPACRDWPLEFLQRIPHFQSNTRGNFTAPHVAGGPDRVTCLTLPERDRPAETSGLVFLPDLNLPALVTDVFWSQRARGRPGALSGPAPAWQRGSQDRYPSGWVQAPSPAGQGAGTGSLRD